ncbi:MAG: hypothetical protein JW951_08665 [Lentisphaerae bacterium]|nr:hypothetical protein [Lentisphaerota bacterium]
MRHFATSNSVRRWTAPLVAVVFVCTASAVLAVGSDIPFQESFESLGDGDSILDQNGWQGPAGAGDAATVVGESYGYNRLLQGSSVTRPLPNTTHNKYMDLQSGSDEISNVFNEVSQTNVYIDMMVKLEQSAADWEPPATNDMQAAFFVNTNGNLVVYHSKWLNPGSGLDFSNVLTVCDNTAVGTGDWNRLTITMDYLTQAANQLKFFQVAIDGQVVSNDLAVNNPVDGLVTGTWFFCANIYDIDPQLSSLGLQGTGNFDDIVVTNAQPLFTGDIKFTVNPIVDTDRGGYTVPGASFLILKGATTNVTVFPTNYWVVNAIDVNGTPLPVTNNIVINDIQQDYTIEIDFEPQRAFNGVPLWWLVAYGFDPSDAGATNDFNLDGDPNWKHWLTSTDPKGTNAFAILDIGSPGGTNYIRWYTGDVNIDPDLDPIRVYRNTDLTNTNPPNYGWVSVDTVDRMWGTNTWWENGPAGSNSIYFYRLETEFAE